MKKKIVIVDDDASLREVMDAALGAKFTVLEAEDGASGLELIAKEIPDLVIVDFAMPRMHGFEVCRRIRGDANLRHIKILMSSSKSYESDIETAKINGADEYLIKPYRVKALREAVDRLLGV